MSFTLMPFLYQTRTILRIPTHRASATIVRSLHASSRRPKETKIPFDYEVGPPDENTPANEVANRGTITLSERQIFERIFADIEARGLKPTTKGDGAPVSDQPSNRSARLIMRQAARDAGQARPATVTSPALLSGAARDRAKALLRFPEPLRGAASKVLDAIKHQALTANDSDASTANADNDLTDDGWKTPSHTFPRALELDAKRYPERTRIEGLITSAASDFELWDVLEKEVFTMPARLGIVKSPVELDNVKSSPNTSRRGRKAMEPAEDNEPAEEDNEPVEKDSNGVEPTLATSEGESTTTKPDNVSSPGNSQKLSLYIHGPLYPAYLLLALRRLDTAFSAPSPLTLSILPRIKELGLESYVLGVSTLFFNELLAIYWARRGDLSGMLDLLEEMRHCGLYFDGQTAKILNQVDEALSGLASGKMRSGLGRALMLMPEYESSQRERIRYWHRLVDLSVLERQNDIGYVEAAAGR
ncbi:hypothetical protein GQX73_g9862 [Xylaria multiplex]|uniref:Mtf2-like C-terminal domain-containing protein n=1 Tax=Xylaria multiplex TaxID=323545 RepID=A0A7C8MMD2_9PEZI|nr:hypothetical protein GQX73_g9862 [Xylaria multiplex]